VQTAEIVATTDWPVCVACAVQERFTSKLRSHEVGRHHNRDIRVIKGGCFYILAVFTSEEFSCTLIRAKSILKTGRAYLIWQRGSN
jgi:hypothetical protein